MVKTKKFAMICLALVMAFALMFGVLMPVKTVEAYTYNGGALGLWERMLEIDNSEKTGPMSEEDKNALFSLIEEYNENYSEGVGLYPYSGIMSVDDLEDYVYGTHDEFMKEHFDELVGNYLFDKLMGELIEGHDSWDDITNQEWETYRAALNELAGEIIYNNIQDLKDEVLADEIDIEEEKVFINGYILLLTGSPLYQSSGSGSGSGSPAGAGIITNTLVATLSVIVLGTAITLLSVKKRTNK